MCRNGVRLHLDDDLLPDGVQQADLMKGRKGQKQLFLDRTPRRSGNQEAERDSGRGHELSPLNDVNTDLDLQVGCQGNDSIQTEQLSLQYVAHKDTTGVSQIKTATGNCKPSRRRWADYTMEDEEECCEPLEDLDKPPAQSGGQQTQDEPLQLEGPKKQISHSNLPMQVNSRGIDSTRNAIKAWIMSGTEQRPQTQNGHSQKGVRSANRTIRGNGNRGRLSSRQALGQHTPSNLGTRGSDDPNRGVTVQGKKLESASFNPFCSKAQKAAQKSGWNRGRVGKWGKSHEGGNPHGGHQRSISTGGNELNEKQLSRRRRSGHVGGSKDWAIPSRGGHNSKGMHKHSDHQDSQFTRQKYTRRQKRHGEMNFGMFDSRSHCSSSQSVDTHSFSGQPLSSQSLDDRRWTPRIEQSRGNSSAPSIQTIRGLGDGHNRSRGPGSRGYRRQPSHWEPNRFGDGQRSGRGSGWRNGQVSPTFQDRQQRNSSADKYNRWSAGSGEDKCGVHSRNYSEGAGPHTYISSLSRREQVLARASKLRMAAPEFRPGNDPNASDLIVSLNPNAEPFMPFNVSGE